MQLQNDYFAAYRSLKLTRDSDGVLIAEFHSGDGPFTFTAQDHTEFVASAADLVKSMRAQNEPVAQKGKVA